MAVPKFTLFLIISLLASTIEACFTYAWQYNTRFKHFFPSDNDRLTYIRDTFCAAEYAKEQSQTKGYCLPNQCEKVFNCILGHVHEATRAKFAAGTLLLGLLPSVLVYLGSSALETSLLARQRPLLASLVAFGSPAVTPTQMFMYSDPVADLQARDGRLVPKLIRNMNPIVATLILLVEYTVVGLAVANVMTAAYYIGQWTITSYDCENPYSPIYWALLTGVMHISGVFTLSCQTKTLKNNASSRSLGKRFTLFLRHEFSPCITHDKLQLEEKPETPFFVFWSFFTTVTTVAHIFYGILTFSSLQFIAQLNAVTMVGRFMASAVACRMVLMFELAGMRNALNGSDQHVN